MDYREFTWFSKFSEIVAACPDREDQDALIVALVRYGATGEVADLGFPLKPIFLSLIDDIDYSIASRSKGKTGGRKSKTTGLENKSESEKPLVSEKEETCCAKKETTGFENETQNEKPLVSESYTQSEKPLVSEADTQKEKPNTIHNNTIHIEKEINKEKDDFGLQCLNALNLILGQTFGRLPPSVAPFVDSMSEHYSLDEVEAMIRFKQREWSGTKYARYLTPKTLFSPDHFEEYIAQSKAQTGEVSEVDYSEYA